MQNGNAVSKTHNWGVKWTPEEDQRLIQGIELYGESDWKKVSDIVATRAPVKCIQRWEKVLRPDLVKGKWTDEEDEILKNIVFKGFEHWGKVADQMPGRTSKQCRERWANYLDPSLLKTAFTQAEDDAVIRLQSEFGNKWAYIARLIPGRTENSVKLRYHALVKQFGEKNSSTVGASGSKSEDAISANNDKALQALKKQRNLKHTGMISDELMMKQVMLDPSLRSGSSSSSNLSSAEQQMLRLHHKQQQQHFHHLQQLQQHHLIQQQREQQQQKQSQHFPSNMHHHMQIQQQILLQQQQQQLMNQKQQGGQLLPGPGMNMSLLHLPGLQSSSHFAAQTTVGSQQLSTTMLPPPTKNIGPSHGPTLVPQLVLPAPSVHPHSFLQQQQQLSGHLNHHQQLSRQLSGQPLQQQQEQTTYLMTDIDDFIVQQQNSKKSPSDYGSSASEPGPGTE